MECELMSLSTPYSIIASIGILLGTILGIGLGCVGLWMNRKTGPTANLPFALLIISGATSAAYRWSFVGGWLFISETSFAFVFANGVLMLSSESLFAKTRCLEQKSTRLYSMGITAFLLGYLSLLLAGAATGPEALTSYTPSRVWFLGATVGYVWAWQRSRLRPDHADVSHVILWMIVASFTSIALWIVKTYWCPQTASEALAYTYVIAIWELSNTYELYCLLVLGVYLRARNLGRNAVWDSRFCVPFVVQWRTHPGDLHVHLISAINIERPAVAASPRETARETRPDRPPRRTRAAPLAHTNRPPSSKGHGHTREEWGDDGIMILVAPPA